MEVRSDRGSFSNRGNTVRSSQTDFRHIQACGITTTFHIRSSILFPDGQDCLKIDQRLKYHK